MEDPSLLYSIQNDIFVAIKKIHRNLKTEKARNKTPNYFEKHERDLDSLWRDFSTNHEKLTTEGKKRDLYFRSNMFVVAEGLYKNTREKLHQMHQYYKLTKFPSDEGSSQKNITQEMNEKQELEDICMERENSDMETEMNPVKLLENSDVATITDCAVMNIEEPSDGVEFISVELLLNELSAQTSSKKEEADDQQKPTYTIGNIDYSILEQYDEEPNRKVSCPVKDCLTQLGSRERMTRHLRQHNGEMPYQCNHCDYATYNSTRIQEHVNTHSGIKPYKCSFCEYSSVSKKYIKQHEAKHCKCDCGFVSKNRSSLEIHQHENCILKEGNKISKYACKHCKRGFATRVSSRTHKQERGLCSICDVIVCDLTGHMKKQHREHRPSDVKIKNYKFVCKTCGWNGGREYSVLLHLIHHPQAVGEEIDVGILKKYNIL